MRDFGVQSPPALRNLLLRICRRKEDDSVKAEWYGIYGMYLFDIYNRLAFDLDEDSCSCYEERQPTEIIAYIHEIAASCVETDHHTSSQRSLRSHL
jgi:hypothetical protein